MARQNNRKADPRIFARGEGKIIGAKSSGREFSLILTGSCPQLVL